MNSSLLVSFLITLCFPLITPHLLFHLVPNQARCYVDELFSDSVMMIKWKIYTQSKADLSSVIPQITIYATSEDSKEQVFTSVPKSAKSKVAFTPGKEGVYRICVIYKTRYSAINEPIYMNMRFGSDNMDEPDINNALQSKDVSNLEGKAKKVLELAKPIIERQKSDLDLENANAETTIKNTKWYKYLTFVQIGLCVLIGLLQLNNFRKYLKSQNVI